MTSEFYFVRNEPPNLPRRAWLAPYVFESREAAENFIVASHNVTSLGYNLAAVKREDVSQTEIDYSLHLHRGSERAREFLRFWSSHEPGVIDAVARVLWLVWEHKTTPDDAEREIKNILLSGLEAKQ